jgi:hypothetical protein
VILIDPAYIKRVLTGFRVRKVLGNDTHNLFALFLFLAFPSLARRIAMSESLSFFPNVGFVQRPERRALFNVP